MGHPTHRIAVKDGQTFYARRNRTTFKTAASAAITRPRDGRSRPKLGVALKLWGGSFVPRPPSEVRLQKRLRALPSFFPRSTRALAMLAGDVPGVPPAGN